MVETTTGTKMVALRPQPEKPWWESSLLLLVFLTLLPVLADEQPQLKFKEFSFLRFYHGAVGNSLDTTVHFFVKITSTTTKRRESCEVLYKFCHKSLNVIRNMRHVKEESWWGPSFETKSLNWSKTSPSLAELQGTIKVFARVPNKSNQIYIFTLY
jgi:hypothetical protein